MSEIYITFTKLAIKGRGLDVIKGKVLWKLLKKEKK